MMSTADENVRPHVYIHVETACYADLKRMHPICPKWY